ncbi:MAG: DNA replication/repair protein RecF [Deltaproteobacteria bacterium]|nr:DNA replication/repair protein RecF [Deltaproteobacteria bacterium]
MHLSSLKLCNYRNFRSVALNPNPGVNLLIGKNAQGKTNLVEAVNLLSCGRSFRTSRARELVCWGEKQGSVVAEVVLNSGQANFTFIIAEKSKQTFINGAQVKSLSDFVGRLLSVSFSPTDLWLIKGAPEMRRRFLDRHASDLDPAFIGHLMTYHRALHNKAKLLRSPSVNENGIRPWNHILAKAAVQVAKMRIHFLSDLQDKVNLIYPQFAATEGRVKVELKTNFFKAPQEVSEAYAEEVLEKNIRRELSAQACLLGPHRDDIEISIGGRNSRSFASQGQSRSLVLALKLGVISLIEELRGERPIVLLDDVYSELDKEREAALHKLVLSQNRQVFVTGTDAMLKTRDLSKAHQIWQIENGEITELLE